MDQERSFPQGTMQQHGTDSNESFHSEHSSSNHSRQGDGQSMIPASPQTVLVGDPPGRQGWPSAYEEYRPEISAPVVESFEMEDNNTTGSGGTSWTLRIPWLRNKRHRRIRHDDENSSIGTNQSRSIVQPGGSASGRKDEQDSVYYGGLMRTTSPSSVYEEASNTVDGLHPESLQEQHPDQLSSTQKDSRRNSKKSTPILDQNLLPQHNPPPPPPPELGELGEPATNESRRFSMSLSGPSKNKNNPNKVFRNRSWISTSSRGSKSDRRRRRRKHGTSRTSEDDSLADFDENEWTPQDSAYGAAIPVCGWVPKRLRQGIEATLIALTVFALVYLVVTTSISIQESKASGKHRNYNGSYVDSGFDDDWYVEVSQYQNDEDDYFNANDNDNNAGDEDSAEGNQGG